MISEFMARNTHTLADEDGAFPDWVELHNTETHGVNLDGWFLTDATNNLTKWRLPATNLAANAYLIVFASGKDRAVPGAPLHTGFQLGGDGEYLALVRPDLSIATEFAPVFPGQFDDLSYGDGQTVTTSTLLASGAGAKFLVPPTVRSGQTGPTPRSMIRRGATRSPASDFPAAARATSDCTPTGPSGKEPARPCRISSPAAPTARSAAPRGSRMTPPAAPC
jgi:hypothetical protein